MNKAMRWLALAILWVGFTFLRVSSAAAETEPNDTREQASPLEIGYDQGSLAASIGSDADLDYYVFAAQAGNTYVIETYAIQANASNAATGLWLYDAGGNLLDNDQWGEFGTGGANARIQYTFVNSGNYYILVKDRTNLNWLGTYSLRILPKYNETGAGWDAANDQEPNDALVLATAIQVGLGQAQTHQLAPHTSYVTNDSDHDYYRFTAEEGRTYVIETFGIQATANNYATALWLYDADGTLLKNDQWGEFGAGGANARMTYTFTTAGEYFILVKDRTNIAWTGTYSLRILPRYDEPGADWDAENDNEPNGVRILANPIEAGWQQAETHLLAPHTAFVTNDSDYDFYHFTAGGHHTYVIETFGIQATGNNAATGLWLYDSNGNYLADDEWGEFGTGGANARIIHTFTVTDTYFVLVKDRNNIAWTGEYSLRVLPQYDEPGAGWDTANDNEPNDTRQLANLLGVGRELGQTHQLAPHSAFVTNDSDYDYYRFQAAQAGPYVIETFDAPDVSTGLFLYSESGTLLANDQYGQFGSGGVDARITFEIAAPGTYILLVKDRTNTVWTGSYAVRVCLETCLVKHYLPIARR